MTKNAYILFGGDTFKKSEAIKYVESESVSSPHKVFSLLNSSHYIEEVYLGWSFVLLKAGQDIYHSGFWKPKVNQQNNKVFNNLSEICDISCGMSNSFMTMKNKRFYHFSNSNFELKPIDIKCEVSPFKIIDTEDLYTAAVTEDGKVFDIKMAENISMMQLNVSFSIKEVSCGKEHVLLLSSSGIVLSYGSGSRGQLGHGNIDKLEQPMIIEALDGVEMKTISAGGWHSAAISYIGDLYMWGWNESGQLGLPCRQSSGNNSPSDEVYTICLFPKIIELDDLKVTSISCGSRHTAAITEDKHVWLWGWNEYGQLGHKTCPLSDKPEKVTLPDNYIPQSVKCKFWNSLITGYFK